MAEPQKIPLHFSISDADVLKYSQPGPRYTSYPTVPNWTSQITPEQVLQNFSQISPDQPLSIYFHIPFCEKLCHFCACNRIIDPEHSQDLQYLDYFVREMDLVAKVLHKDHRVTQWHWGGGTPTFLSATQIGNLTEEFKKRFTLTRDAEISMEVNPVVTSEEQIVVLRKLGFNRISLGVQDFDPVVQDAINRHQSYEQTAELINICRREGIASINLDLIYGLPKQNELSFEDSIRKVMDLRPDRLAVYSFAKVPWKQPFQRRFRDEDLPEGQIKVKLYLLARTLLMQAGYVPIGMDHFALPTDELAVAAKERQLQRNFMGYTTKPDTQLIGFGVSAISQTQSLFVQNLKTLPPYYRAIEEGKLPVMIGCHLDKDDQLHRQAILSLMCNFELVWETFNERHQVEGQKYFAKEVEALSPLEKDGLVKITNTGIEVIDRGQVLVRNIAMIFDQYLEEAAPPKQFSNTF